MYSPRKVLKAPTDFEFPYSPYSIQQDFMQKLYTVIEEKKIGVFESPTGTGKSLTLTCAALRWLEDHEALVRLDLQNHIVDIRQKMEMLETNTPKNFDWISEHYTATQHRDKLLKLENLSRRLEQHEQRLREICERSSANKSTERPTENKENYSKINGDKGSTNDAAELYRDVQIFFCSRTHSQLAQIAEEVKRTAYGNRIRCISIASRQQLCIHPHLRKLPSASLINERCLELSKIHTANSGRDSQKATATIASGDSNDIYNQKEAQMGRLKNSSKCYFKGPQVSQLSDMALTGVLDIEDLVKEGQNIGACPYYAARSSTMSAQLILMPYQLLLHRRTRLQSGLNIKGAIIIIDEAHNLIDTISQLHSTELTLPQLQLAQQQIYSYKLHYLNLFSSNNLLFINQLVFVAKSLIKILQPLSNIASTTTRLFRTYDLTAECDFFNIDLFQLLEFCERTRLAQKLHSFAQCSEHIVTQKEANESIIFKNSAVGLLRQMQTDHLDRRKTNDNIVPMVADEQKIEINFKELQTNSLVPIRSLLAFLEALTERAEDGRVLVTVAHELSSCSSLKYILLNPGDHFEDIVRDARAIIVAGGTMQPTAELSAQLFRSCPERLQLQFYDHVVPSDAVLPLVVQRGAIGHRLCFKYSQRSSNEMLSELGMLLQNVCNVVPAGLVCFFPSYEYLDEVYRHLERTGALTYISVRKRIFREPRSSSTGQSTEQLLVEYADIIQQNQGAMLLSVIGGKLSEGLNFSDELGRGVVVVGMPYPNRHSPELQERIKYMDNVFGPCAGNEYYENLCMKAVNQCIGRSVRHIRDYACVFLVDERYANERIQNKLPRWIGRNLQTPKTFGSMQSAIAKFFKGKCSM